MKRVVLISMLILGVFGLVSCEDAIFRAPIGKHKIVGVSLVYDSSPKAVVSLDLAINEYKILFPKEFDSLMLKLGYARIDNEFRKRLSKQQTSN